MQRSLTGIQNLEHFQAVIAVSPRSFASDDAFNEVLTLVPEGLLGWKCYRLALPFMRYRKAVSPIDTVRIHDKFPLFFHVIEYRHVVGADNQPLLFEGMEPTYKDMRLDAALKLAGCQGGVIDLRIYKTPSRSSYTDWHFVQKVQDGGDIMWGEAPQNVLF